MSVVNRLWSRSIIKFLWKSDTNVFDGKGGSPYSKSNTKILIDRELKVKGRFEGTIDIPVSLCIRRLSG